MNRLDNKFGSSFSKEELNAASRLVEIARCQSGPALLVIALNKLGLFEKLHDHPMSFDALRQHFQLSTRAMVVLITALREMNTVKLVPPGNYHLTAMAESCLVRSGASFIGDYISIMVSRSAVNEMFLHLRRGKPISWQGRGPAFTYRSGQPSASNHPNAARSATSALAGMARSVAPTVAANSSLGRCTTLLDIGAGSGWFSFAALQLNPRLRAILVDRPEVLRVAKSVAAGLGLLDRLSFKPADMFQDVLPRKMDAILLSNIIHDWDVPDCQRLIKRCSTALAPGGKLLIHDRFQDNGGNDSLSAALHSANLFVLTEGRLYCASEVLSWCKAAKLRASSALLPTANGYSLLKAIRPS